MRAVIQRVRNASVSVNTMPVSNIKEGLVVLLGIHSDDTLEQAQWMAHKIVNVRIFPDEDDRMNCSLLETNRELMIVSQFTLYGDAQKGFRPSFIEAAKPEVAEPLYQYIVDKIRIDNRIEVQTGVFGAMMELSLTNWGPVTIILDKR